MFWYTGQWFMQAPQRMQRSMSCIAEPTKRVRPASTSTMCICSGPSVSSGRLGPVVSVT